MFEDGLLRFARHDGQAVVGWLALLLLVAALLLAGHFLWRLPRPALTLLAVALALGGAGYALTGRPDAATAAIEEEAA